MILDLVTLNDKRLHEKSLNVDKFNSELAELAEDMFDTMYEAGGIGLSAVQVGVMKRLFVTDVPNGCGKLVFINPVIKDLSEKTKIHEEGCLSVPGINAEVERPDKIVIEYYDLNGKLKKLKTGGLQAVCIQHEYDHLEGILFIDRLEPEHKIQKVSEYRKLKKV
jgi:peptide deformylase